MYFPAPLSVEVEPKHQVVDYGRPATFKCNYRGNPVKAVFWLKNGVNIGHSEKTLRINSVTKEDRGMYQCFVINDQVRITQSIYYMHGYGTYSNYYAYFRKARRRPASSNSAAASTRPSSSRPSIPSVSSPALS